MLSGVSGISYRKPRATARHQRCRLSASGGCSSTTRPKFARWRRCQLVTDGDAPTCSDSWVAVAGPFFCSQLSAASRTGWASARIACGSVISKSPYGFLRDMFRE